MIGFGTNYNPLGCKKKTTNIYQFMDTLVCDDLVIKSNQS
jgi:hypothetical protein